MTFLIPPGSKLYFSPTLKNSDSWEDKLLISRDERQLKVYEHVKSVFKTMRNFFEISRVQLGDFNPNSSIFSYINTISMSKEHIALLAFQETITTEAEKS